MTKPGSFSLVVYWRAFLRTIFRGKILLVAQFESGHQQSTTWELAHTSDNVRKRNDLTRKRRKTMASNKETNLEAGKAMFFEQILT